MDKYEYPLGVQWRASTPEHAAARVFGGKPGKYLATVQTGYRPTGNGGMHSYHWVDVTSADGTEWLGDIPMVDE